MIVGDEGYIRIEDFAIKPYKWRSSQIAKVRVDVIAIDGQTCFIEILGDAKTGNNPCTGWQSCHNFVRTDLTKIYTTLAQAKQKTSAILDPRVGDTVEVITWEWDHNAGQYAKQQYRALIVASSLKYHKSYFDLSTYNGIKTGVSSSNFLVVDRP